METNEPKWEKKTARITALIEPSLKETVESHCRNNGISIGVFLRNVLRESLK